MAENSISFRKPLRIGRQLLDMRHPRVMAILNLTPDSFYDGARLCNDKALLARAEACLHAGADILDIGGYSSRPGAEDIAPKEEIRRISRPVQLLSKHFPEALLSIDTFRVSVAEAALSAGAHMINDISGGQLDAEMFPFVARHRVPYVLMHMRGTPQTMADCTDYSDIHREVFAFLQAQLHTLREAGAADVLVDVGFGFAKRAAQGFALLRDLHIFHHLGAPLLVGLSRKSMIYRTLSCTPAEALYGTTALHMYALCQGARLLRVHDVAEARQTITLYRALHP